MTGPGPALRPRLRAPRATSRGAGGHYVEWRRRFVERAEWRLTEHFFKAMFDFGFLSEVGADSFKRLLVGSVGGFIAFGLLLTRVYMGKYAAILGAGSQERYRSAILGDDMMIIGLPMLLVAFITLLVSQALFPDERDFRILGPLPVPRIVVFRAKLAALLLFTGLFTAAAHVSLAPLVLLTSLNPWDRAGVPLRVVAWAFASVTASAFAVLLIAAVVGALTLALSRSQMQALSTITRSIVLGSLVVCLPLVSHLPSLAASVTTRAGWTVLLPPAWFLGLERILQGGADPWLLRLGTIGVAVTAAVTAIVAVVYVVLFRNFERLMLRHDASPGSSRRRERAAPRHNGSPAFDGVYRFTLATIRRSQLHQGVLVGLSACGIGFAIIFLTGVRLTTAALVVPFVLMFACGLAVRAALALPIDYRANWVFRVTEDDGARREQMRAVDSVVTTHVIAVPVSVAAPLLWMAHGLAGLAATTAVAAVGFAFVHIVLLDWRRIPFTCSYLPGKRFIGHSSLVGVASCVIFTVASAGLLGNTLASPTRGAMMVASLFVLGYWLRERRLGVWTRTPLMFEDEFPDQPVQLQL